MVAIPVVLDSFSWRTRTAAKEAYKSILRTSGYGIGDVIADPIHDLMLRELVERHPEAVDKIGPGIREFFIGRTADGDRQHVSPNAIGIWIRQLDDNPVDFSYISAIDQHSMKSDVKEAMRLAVDPIRIDYRDRQFASGTSVASAISGRPFEHRADAQVIYATPAWAQLAYVFAQQSGGWDSFALTSGGTGVQIGTRFADSQVEAAWIEFHNEHANFALATASEAAQRPRVSENGWDPTP